jgi:hypothetical protein
MSRYLDKCAIPDLVGSPFSALAVLCADTTPIDSITIDEWKDKETSIRANFTTDVWITGVDGMLSCQYWNKNSDWKRYTGPWNHTFAQPVVVVGTRFDPVTPWYEARNTVDLMNSGHDQVNAVLITHDGHGHCSTTQTSQCTDYIREFLVNDVVPPQNVYCQAETHIFHQRWSCFGSSYIHSFSIFTSFVIKSRYVFLRILRLFRAHL